MNNCTMNCKRAGLSAIAVFAFIFIFEWLFHGSIMKDLYTETAHLWRTEEEMLSLFHFLIIGQIAISIMFAWIFTKGYEGKGIMEGVRYGVLMSLFLSAPSFTMYAVAPYTPMLLIYWFAGSVIEFAIAGAIVASIYRPKIS